MHRQPETTSVVACLCAILPVGSCVCLCLLVVRQRETRRGQSALLGVKGVGGGAGDLVQHCMNVLTVMCGTVVLCEKVQLVCSVGWDCLGQFRTSALMFPNLYVCRRRDFAGYAIATFVSIALGMNVLRPMSPAAVV